MEPLKILGITMTEDGTRLYTNYTKVNELFPSGVPGSYTKEFVDTVIRKGTPRNEKLCNILKRAEKGEKGEKNNPKLMNGTFRNFIDFPNIWDMDELNATLTYCEKVDKLSYEPCKYEVPLKRSPRFRFMAIPSNYRLPTEYGYVPQSTHFDHVVVENFRTVPADSSMPGYRPELFDYDPRNQYKNYSSVNEDVAVLHLHIVPICGFGGLPSIAFVQAIAELNDGTVVYILSLNWRYANAGLFDLTRSFPRRFANTFGKLVNPGKSFTTHIYVHDLAAFDSLSLQGPTTASPLGSGWESATKPYAKNGRVYIHLGDTSLANKLVNFFKKREMANKIRQFGEDCEGVQFLADIEWENWVEQRRKKCPTTNLK